MKKVNLLLFLNVYMGFFMANPAQKNNESVEIAVPVVLDYKNKKKQIEDALVSCLLKKYVTDWNNKNSVNILGRTLNKDEIKKIVLDLKNDENIVREVTLFFTKYSANEENLQFNNNFRFMVKWFLIPMKLIAFYVISKGVYDDIFYAIKNKHVVDLKDFYFRLLLDVVVNCVFNIVPFKYYYNYLKQNNYTEDINTKNCQIETLLNKKIHDLVILLNDVKIN